MIQGFNWFKGSNGSMVKFVQRAQIDLGSIQFEGSTVQIVQFVQGFKWFKGSNSPMVQIGQGLK